MVLSVLAELGKGIKTAEQGDGRVFHEGAFPLCGYTDTESAMARSLWAPGDIVLCQTEEPAGAEQHSPTEAFPHGRAPIAAVVPSFDLPLSGTGVAHNARRPTLTPAVSPPPAGTTACSGPWLPIPTNPPRRRHGKWHWRVSGRRRTPLLLQWIIPSSSPFPHPSEGKEAGELQTAKGRGSTEDSRPFAAARTFQLRRLGTASPLT